MYFNRVIVSLAMLIVGSWLAAFVQTNAGEVKVHDIRFVGSSGESMSALLYVPRGVTSENKAPGILAVHGYINSRETQSGFAIEFARRGFVVLALDQRGHGFSDPPAFAAGFGGPDGLAYLRGLPFVDTGNIGLEGHSMGGWASLAAAATDADGYQAMVLEGASTGTMGAPEGTPEFPRNVLVVYSQYDEFAQFMWGARTAPDIVETDKLKTLFDTDTSVEVGKLYGDIEAGTARKLTQPAVTHPGDHLSRRAIGDAAAWFQRVLDGGNDLPASDQIWYWKELGTLIALVGLIALIYPLVEWVVSWPFFRPVTGTPLGHVSNDTASLAITGSLMAIIPALTFFPLQVLASYIIPANLVLPQQMTNGIMLWALGNAAIMLGLFKWWRDQRHVERVDLAMPTDAVIVVRSALAAGICCGFLYGALMLADYFFTIDFRFWVVALKLMSPAHFQMFLIYLLPFTAFFIVLSMALHNQLRVAHRSIAADTCINVGVLALGFVVLLLIQYIPLFAGSTMTIASQPLLTILAIQFVPLMTVVAIISTWCFHKTRQIWVGAFINSIFVTWYIVAGQATQAVPMGMG
ncbi:MAG: alpha/beta fold hydrolase [Pseudomonadales bacterium]